MLDSQQASGRSRPGSIPARARVEPLRAIVRRRRRLSWLQALLLVCSVSVLVVLSAAGLVTRTDPHRYPDFATGLWWAVTTVTTVGYGDVVPASAAGRVVAGGVMFIGIASFAFLTAVAASVIVVSDVAEEEREIKREEGLILDQLRELNARIAAMESALAAGHGDWPSSYDRSSTLPRTDSGVRMLGQDQGS